MAEFVPNLYAHFPFCRRRCAYCALYSRTGVSQADRDAYARKVAEEILRFDGAVWSPRPAGTIYFGGGSPALCDLKPIFSALRLQLSTTTEFTVELHPLDVNAPLLEILKAGGVNRISMGVQSFDDATLAAMGRGYTIDDALRAFELVKKYFDNAGIDLIVGFPGDPGLRRPNTESAKTRRNGDCLRRFAELGMRHCSVYSLQNERGLKNVPDDDVVLDGIREMAGRLKELGLERYEISNYAVPGYECRHNLAVWRGEDYLGIGEGSCGRVGLTRTRGLRKGEYSTEALSEDEDRKERTIFRLRTRDGLDTTRFPEWRPILDRFVEEGLLTTSSDNPLGGAVRSPRPTDDQLPATIYRLTARGAEVCDAILAEIV